MNAQGDLKSSCHKYLSGGLNFQNYMQTRQQKFKNMVTFPTIIMSLQYKNGEKGKILKLN